MKNILILILLSIVFFTLPAKAQVIDTSETNSVTITLGNTGKPLLVKQYLNEMNPGMSWKGIIIEALKSFYRNSQEVVDNKEADKVSSSWQNLTEDQQARIKSILNE